MLPFTKQASARQERDRHPGCSRHLHDTSTSIGGANLSGPIAADKEFTASISVFFLKERVQSHNSST